MDIDRMWEIVIAVLLAVAGGFARVLNRKDNKKLKLTRILSELFISGFAGIMILMFARASGLSGDWVGVVCGMAGWVGPKILDLLSKAAVKTMNIDSNSNGNNKGNDE
jgi:hypothetical protein